jgi:hypothetical protein
VPPLAATDAHDGAEGVFGCACKDRMAFWSSVFCFLRLRCSDLMSTSSFLMLSIMLFWLVMMLLCCAIVSLRLSMSRQNSSRLIPPPSRSGEIETLVVGNGGSICCEACSLICGAVVYCSNCADLWARVLSDCWASCTFAPGFFVRPLGGAAGGSGGGVADTRSGVEAAIGAPGLRSVGRRGRLAAGTS